MKLMTIWEAYNKSAYKVRAAAEEHSFAIRMHDIEDIRGYGEKVERYQRQRWAFADRLRQRIELMDSYDSLGKKLGNDLIEVFERHMREEERKTWDRIWNGDPDIVGFEGLEEFLGDKTLHDSTDD